MAVSVASIIDGINIGATKKAVEKLLYAAWARRHLGRLRRTPEGDELAEKLETALSLLPTEQQEVIRVRYLDDSDIPSDCSAMYGVCMSERKYRRVKAAALINLAYALSIEVYENTAAAHANVSATAVFMKLCYSKKSATTLSADHVNDSNSGIAIAVNSVI